ncbi:MAG: Gfo/Idh/MocA family oxidoreductase [Chloroflexi bacterium]|nr:Gfo/Idh/MocA family oxidoreductase [Chloroflexota bacterium]
MAPIRTGLIGTGARAHSYGSYISENQDEFELAAVADIVPDKLNGYADEYQVPASARYPSVEELLDRGPELDALVITTNDASHEPVAISAFQASLPVLLEKPIATSAEGAYCVVHGADSRGLSLTIGLVLRYTPFYRKVKELVDGGAVGRMIQVEAKEVLHVHHTATSFMREHYRRREDCGSFILTKCCHDFDIFNWIVGASPVRVASFGGLDYFLPRSDAALRCSECDRTHVCPFYGPRAYGNRRSTPNTDLCVYHTEKDTVDNQNCLIEYDNGVRLAFSVMMLGARERREIHIVGDEGELRGDFEKNEIVVDRFWPTETWRFDLSTPAHGHGGGDNALMSDFRHQILGTAEGGPLASALAARESVIVGVGMDEAQRSGQTVELDQLRARGESAIHAGAS